MTKILYVAPENVTGGFGLFAKGHRQRGNESRFVTFFPNAFGFEEDICLNLRFMPQNRIVSSVRNKVKQANDIPHIAELSGNPPFWKAPSKLSQTLFQIRDFINSPRILSAIRKHHLNKYDIYHFEQGIDLFRDGRWVKQLAGKGKGIVCFYHGSDVRNRGVIEAVHRHSVLNLTSEIDLLQRIPGMKYLFLPLDTDQITPQRREPDGKIRIGHAARNRMFKGSDTIESIVLKLAKKYPIDWVMIENVPHPVVMKMKNGCNIFIDQITDAGGWGYGASSVESLAMGIPTISRINPEVDAFLGKHPFISATADDLEKKLIDLIEQPDKRTIIAHESREWVVRTHGINSVMDRLYSYYREADLI